VSNPIPFLLGLSECFLPVWAQVPLTDQFRVNTNITRDQTSPSAAMLNNGNIVMVWRSDQHEYEKYGIYAQFINRSGHKICDEFLVSSSTTNYQAFPSVAVLKDGNFVIVLSFNLFNSVEIRGQLFNESGSKVGLEFKFREVSGSSPTVASLDDGNFVVAWTEMWTNQWGYAQIHVLSQLFNANTSKIGDFTKTPGSRSSISSLKNGNFVITWDRTSPNATEIYAQLYHTNASKLGDEFQVNTYITAQQTHPSVGCLSNGNFFIAWAGFKHSNILNVDGQLFHPNGSKIGEELWVNKNDKLYSGSQPFVSGLDTNKFVVFWGGLVGQIFDVNGTSIGNTFQANTIDSGGNSRAETLSLGNFTFIVFWSGFDSSGVGSRWDVHARILSDELAIASPSSSSASSSTLSSTSTSTLTSTSTSSSTGSDPTPPGRLTSSTSESSHTIASSLLFGMFMLWLGLS